MKITFVEAASDQEIFFKEKLPGHELFFIPSADLPSADPETEVLCVFVHSNISKNTLDRLGSLKFVATMSTGFDHIDLKACKAKGVAVSNVPAYGENTVAEFAFGLILNLYRKIPEAMARIKEEGKFYSEGLTGFDMLNKTIGIVGTGRIGRHAVKIAKGFGMKVLAFDPYPQEDLAKEMDFTYTTLDDLLGLSDIVSLHAPYSPQTHHMINAAALSKMKPSALLINTSRGGLVDTLALAEALKNSQILGAGLDVLEEEGYIMDDSALLKSEPTEGKLKTLLVEMELMHKANVIITPHNAFNTIEAIHRILQTTVENIQAFLENKPKNLVNMG